MDQIRTGKFISQLRHEKNLTQKQLADKIGVSDRAVSKWENGRGMPDYALVQPLCETLGISFNELLEGERINEEVSQDKIQKTLKDVYGNYSSLLKKLSLWKLFSSIAIACFVLVAGAFVIDNYRMSNGQPYLFSNWGRAISLDLKYEDEKIMIATEDYFLDVLDQQSRDIDKDNLRSFVESHLFKAVKQKDGSYLAYIWILEETCSLDESGKAVNETGSSMPYKVHLKEDSNGNFTVTEVEAPRESGDYRKMLKQLFPSDVLRQIDRFQAEGISGRMMLWLIHQKQLWESSQQ